MNLNSSVFFHNFTAKNVCSINKEFLEKDIDKFYFDFEMKKTEWITICGFSEQVGHFKAVKFVGSESYYYDYKFLEFYNVNLKLNKSVLFVLNEEIQETTKYKINYEEEGLLNIFWKGSDKDKIQDVKLYKDSLTNPSDLIYHSLYISNYEHYYSLKVKKQLKYFLIYKSQDDYNNRTIYYNIF